MEALICARGYACVTTRIPGNVVRVRFLFWNINRKPLQSLIAAIVEERDVDVVILAENTIPLVPLLTSLNKDDRGTYTLAPSTNRRLHIFSRLPDRLIPRLNDHGAISIRRVIPPVGRDIVLVGAHLPSKLYDKEVDQTLLCSRIRRLVETQEERVGHTRTLIIGDLNLNPFEPGAVAADGFHDVMSRRLAQKRSRTVDGEKRYFFYNPMWGRFGDATPGPPGTCYYGPTGQISFFWNMFDQVLVRPDLLACFRDEDVEVLTRAGSVSLLTEGSEVPDRETASDHLPLLCNLNL